MKITTDDLIETLADPDCGWHNDLATGETQLIMRVSGRHEMIGSYHTEYNASLTGVQVARLRRMIITRAVFER